eukprot:gene13804-13925_t
MNALLEAADHIVKLPSPISDSEARHLLESQPLEAVFRLLSTHDCEDNQLDTVCHALSKVFSTPYGASVLPTAAPYAEAALRSPEHRLRRLGCQQLGQLLQLTADQQQQQQLEDSLINTLKDADVGVAREAEVALTAYAAAHPAVLQAWLLGGSTASQQLQQLADSSNATTRMRAFALVIAAAASSAAGVELLKQSGMMNQLLSQLSPSDPLSCLVALQLLQELVQNRGPGAAGVMQQLLFPSLLPLLDAPDTAAGALPIAAQLAAAVAAAGGDSHDVIHYGNGNGVIGAGGADSLLMRMAELLDDRGSASNEMEVVVLDAACQMAVVSAAAADLVAAAPGNLLNAICDRALGRTAPPEVRLAALHALASVGGVERAGEAADRTAALLLPSQEDALRQGVFGAVSGAAGGVGGARSPAEAVLHLLQQPFGDLRAAVYRCCSALVLRSWFAADGCNTPALISRLCSSDSESGQQACEWRHSTVMALQATVQYLLGLPDGAAEASYKQQLPAGVQQQLAVAARGGPYGAATRGSSQQSHFVATVPR